MVQLKYLAPKQFTIEITEHQFLLRTDKELQLIVILSGETGSIL